jgi:hypothetical protein
MSWLSNFTHPGRGYDKAQDTLNQYYNQGQGYLNPYNQAGQALTPSLFQAFQSLLNPQGLQDQWASNYKESEGAKQAEGMAQQHGLDAASSMGLLGSSPALSAIQQGTSQIGINDKQNYMNDLMQKYLAGIGLGQNVYNTGAGAAGQMGNNAMNQGQNSAQLEYNKQNAQGDLFGRLLGTAGSLAGGYFAGNNPWSTKGGH